MFMRRPGPCKCGGVHAAARHTRLGVRERPVGACGWPQVASLGEGRRGGEGLGTRALGAWQREAARETGKVVRTVGGELRKGGIRWLQERCRSVGRTGAGGAMVAVSRTWCGEPRAPQGRDCPDPRCPGTWRLMPLLLPQPACVGCGSAPATPACSPLHPPPHRYHRDEELAQPSRCPP